MITNASALPKPPSARRAPLEPKAVVKEESLIAPPSDDALKGFVEIKSPSVEKPSLVTTKSSSKTQTKDDFSFSKKLESAMESKGTSKPRQKAELSNKESMTAQRNVEAEEPKQNIVKEPVKQPSAKTVDVMTQGPRQEEIKAKDNPVQDFMDSLESEFGVDSTEFLAAIAALSAKDLVTPAEETAQKVVENLNIDASKKTEILSKYNQMLSKWQAQQGTSTQGDSELSKAIPITAAVSTATYLATKNSLPQEASAPFAADVSASNGLNLPEGFEMTESVKPVQIKSPTTNTEITENLNQVNVQSNVVQAPVKEANTQDVLALQNQLMQQKLAAHEVTDEVATEPAATDSAESELMQKLKKMDEALQNMNPQTGKEDVAGVVQKQSGKNASENGQQAFGQNQKFDTVLSGEKKSDLKVEDSTKSAKAMDFDSMLNAQAQPVKQESVHLSSSAAAAGLAAKVQNGDETAANMKEVMQKAQIMIKHGGGEMKVTMSPEHLGQIQMKVAVTDGKVDIAMLTDNHVTKKALESSLHELRASLGDMRLNAGEIKVDVASQSSNHDLQSQMNDQQRRDQQASQFFNDFRQNNEARRQGLMMDMMGSRAYGSQSSEPKLEPQVLGGGLRSKAMGEGKRLNLVA